MLLDDYIPVRQAPAWANFMKTIGWDVETTVSGITLFFRSFGFFGALAKLQKQKPFDEKDLLEVENICLRRKAMFLKIEPFIGQDEDILLRNGFIKNLFPLSPPSTMLTDLTKSEADHWNVLSHSAKYSINRARREGCSFSAKQNPTDSELSSFHKIVQETGKREKFWVGPLSEVLLRAKSFAPLVWLVSISDADGEVTAQKLFLGYENTVTYILGGSTQKNKKQKSGYELMWRSILYFKNLGYKFIDWEGLDDKRFPMFTKDWGGFSHFKEKFGGIRVEFPYPYIKYYSRIFKFLSKYQNLPF